jgi:hypothetical protein
MPPSITSTRPDVRNARTNTLYETQDREDFCARFEAATGRSVNEVIEQVIIPTAHKAVYLTGSLPLGMATSTSDVDFAVLVDSKEALVGDGKVASANSSQRLAFHNESDALRAGLFNTVMNGITVEVTAVVTGALQRIQKRLRSRGPELSEGEIMMVGRLSTGWRLWQTDRYVERSEVVLPDMAFDIYCCTRNFTFALLYRRKALGALKAADLLLACHMARLSVEMAYVAWFASEGLSYLGPRWLAQLGIARGAAARIQRNPLLKEGFPLLFPPLPEMPLQATNYLQEVAKFLKSMQALIEQKTVFRIAFRACPQICTPE